MSTKIGSPPIAAALPNNNNRNRRRRRNKIILLTTTTHSLPIGFQFGFTPIFSIKPSPSASVAAQSQTSSSANANASASGSPQQQPSTIQILKSHIYQALQGTNRGIFGIPSERKSEIEYLVKQLESLNPTSDPSLQLEKVGGCWKLVYSTITILGSKRTKLGLRDFITLGEFFQIIDVSQGKAVNVIKFNAKGFKSLNGELTIEASFKVSSKSRVDIHYSNSKITPDQLMNVFQKNYGLLLGIFNPDGWLEITYIDATMRIGRDDKGNIFILERSEANP